MIGDLRSRPHLASASEVRERRSALFLQGRSHGVIAESIRGPRGVNSQLPIFDGQKWRSRRGVNSEICLRIVRGPGFDLFFAGRQRGVNSGSTRSQFGASSQMLIFTRRKLGQSPTQLHPSQWCTGSVNGLSGWPSGGRAGRLCRLAEREKKPTCLKFETSIGARSSATLHRELCQEQ